MKLFLWRAIGVGILLVSTVIWADNDSDNGEDDDHDNDMDPLDTITTSNPNYRDENGVNNDPQNNPKPVFVGIPRISPTYRKCMDAAGDPVAEFRCIVDDPIAQRREFDQGRLADFPESDGMYHMGIAQRVDGSEAERASIQQVVQQMVDYFYNEVYTKPEYDGVRHQCANYYELCAFWAAVGECESNRQFMIPNCAAACRFCLLHRVAMGRK
mmetsp:Transcript_16340/g.44945  ORF Transcript_16340/g.44945 Transcript_16340/m.44945 type:complete len:213 (-) Transcript_16340:372-1010(-)